ncbi:MAG: hypothetical protein WD431_00290 [Cyclobacteriaceae bacterium]
MSGTKYDKGLRMSNTQMVVYYRQRQDIHPVCLGLLMLQYEIERIDDRKG